MNPRAPTLQARRFNHSTWPPPKHCKPTSTSMIANMYVIVTFPDELKKIYIHVLHTILSGKHKPFGYNLCSVGPTSSMLGKQYTHVIQMFCICCVTTYLIITPDVLYSHASRISASMNVFCAYLMDTAG